MEQKNWSIVRRTVWYLRYDTEEEVLLMNKTYQSLRLFTNFFLPVMQLTGGHDREPGSPGFEEILM